MTREKVLITVKTYPTLSKKYLEVACTAGFREDGSWIRLYPIPFRLLESDNRYKKYQWIDVPVERNWRDPRPESYKVVDKDRISVISTISTGKNCDWFERKRLILGKPASRIFKKKSEIIEKAHADELSLAIFKPKKVTDFKAKKVDDCYSADVLNGVENHLKQFDLLGNAPFEDFKPVKKLPYKFFYTFEDEVGAASTLMIEDWEIGALYWNCVESGSPEAAVKKVREKYMDDFAKKRDLYLFLGTTLKFHPRNPNNPFIIIGTFHPPIEKQTNLL